MDKRLIKIYVITVRHFTDRHDHIQRLAVRFGFDFQYVLKFDADQLSKADLAMVSADLAPKSASNVLKHLEAQKMFIEQHQAEGLALILEDDVVLFDDFFERLEDIIPKLAQFDPGFLIFLGGADNKIDERFLHSSDNDLIETPITTAEAYLVDGFSCIRRVAWVRENIINKQADHQLKEIDNLLGIRHYRIAKAMATQGSITGLFQTALDDSRAKRSVLYLKSRFYWNQFRRQVAPKLLFQLKRFF